MLFRWSRRGSAVSGKEIEVRKGKELEEMGKLEKGIKKEKEKK